MPKIACLLLCLSSCVGVVADDISLPEGLQSFSEGNGGQPVFQGAAGEWDALIRERGWVMRTDGEWRLWYTGYNPDEQPVTMRLGLATSADGIHWERHPANPLIEEDWVEDMMVVRQDNRYLMFAEGAGDQAQMLTSDDGVRWERAGTLDVRLSNGNPIPPGPFGTPTVIRTEQGWHLFYERRDAGIWVARSEDLQTWINISDDPVISPGPEPYCELMIALNQIISVDGKFVAVLHGTGSTQKPRDWCTYFAVSDDLIHWNMAPGNPVLPVKDNKSSGVLVHDGVRYRLYTMHGAVRVHSAR